MNDKQFDELLESVRDMGRHMRGESVSGVRVREVPEPDVKPGSQRRMGSPVGYASRTLPPDGHGRR